MPSQLLVDTIEHFLQQGETKEDIKEYLLSEGWQENAIDEVLKDAKKPPSFWEQTTIYPYFKALDARTANLPPKVIIGISVSLALIVIVVVFVSYLLINPYNFQTSNRDTERDRAYAQITDGLGRFYSHNGYYPKNLAELVPGYIGTVPVDPETRNEYGYSTSLRGDRYYLCIHFESKSPSSGCVNNEEVK